MGFKTLTNFFSVVASKLMGLSTPANFNTMAAVDGESVISGSNGFFETAWQIIKTSIGDTLILAYETIVRLFYAIGHWVLTLIDFIFVFVRQLVGMNTNFDSLEEITQGDIIFQFLFNESVIKIIRNLLIFSLVLLIIFCIFAIIKSEYAFITDQGGSSKKQILVSALRSLFLMVFVPLVVIGSIIMSNAILRSVYLVTSSGNSSFSMGSQIFIASTYDANAYRRYATQNFKIPITFNFNEINSSDNISGYYTDGTVAEMDEALKSFRSQDVWTRGYKTFLMFSSGSFLTMSDIDALDRQYLEENKTSSYHAAYDEGIHTRREQYFVMADVIEYAMKNNVAIYFKSLEEVYESYYEVDPQVRLKSDSVMPIGKNDGDYFVDVKYVDDNGATTYKHVGGEKDEADGATFVIALERTVTVNTGTEKEPVEEQISYFYPLMNGFDNFSTDYYQGTRNVVIARGMFEDGKYPTAIKENDGVVEFYRDDMNIPLLADFFPKISYELPAGSTESWGLKILKGALSYLTGVDVSQFIPYVYISVDVFHLFTKTSNTIVDLQNGRMKIDYNFTSKDFDKANVYKLSDFNLVIFVFACSILSSMLIKIVFGLVFRTLDVLTLAITYPAVLSTMPLDDGRRFKTWCQTFISKLLPIYSIVVAINVVLMIAPVAWEVKLFTTADIQYGIAMGELGSFVTANFLNMLMHFIFVMVAFSSIEPFINSLGSFLVKSKEKGNPIINDGNMVLKDLKALPKRAGNVVSGAFILDVVAPKGEDKERHLLGGAAGWIPGINLVSGEISHAMEPINKTRQYMRSTGTTADLQSLKQSAETVKEVASNVDASTAAELATSGATAGADVGTLGASGAAMGTAGAAAGGTDIAADGVEDIIGAGDEAGAGGSGEAGGGGEAASGLEAVGQESSVPSDFTQKLEDAHPTDEKDEDSAVDRMMGEGGAASSAEVIPADQNNEAANQATEAAQEKRQDFVENGLDAIGNAIPVNGVATGALSLAAKTLAKTTKFAYKTSKTAVKFAGKLALAVGKLALGLTKTALKMTGRVVKTSAKALYAYGTGQQGGLKTIGQILFNAGVGSAVIGASQLTKSGMKFGKDVVKASASTTGSVLKNFGSAYFGKSSGRSGKVTAAVIDDSQQGSLPIGQTGESGSDKNTGSEKDAKSTDLKEQNSDKSNKDSSVVGDEKSDGKEDAGEAKEEGNTEEADKTSEADENKEQKPTDEGSDAGAESEGVTQTSKETKATRSDSATAKTSTKAASSGSRKTSSSSRASRVDSSKAGVNAKAAAGESGKSSRTGSASSAGGTAQTKKKVTIHVDGSPSDFEAQVSKKKGKDSVIARRKTSHKNSARKTGNSKLSQKSSKSNAESVKNKKGKDSVIALGKTSHKNSTRKSKK